jgi:hypothetical protein
MNICTYWMKSPIPFMTELESEVKEKIEDDSRNRNEALVLLGVPDLGFFET